MDDEFHDAASDDVVPDSSDVGSGAAAGAPEKKRGSVLKRAFGRKKRDSASKSDEETGQDGASSSSDLSEQDLDADLAVVDRAVRLFLASKFNEAEALLTTELDRQEQEGRRSSPSLYCTLGAGVLQYLKALLTFAGEDIQLALQSLNECVALAHKHRKKEALVSHIMHRDTDDLTVVQDLLLLQGHTLGHYVALRVACRAGLCRSIPTESYTLSHPRRRPSELCQRNCQHPVQLRHLQRVPALH